MKRLLVLPAVLSLVMLTFWSKAEAGPSLLIKSSAPVRMSNSLDGQAILSARNMAPGKTDQGEVAISNLGPRREFLMLRLQGQKSSKGFESQVLLAIWQRRKAGNKIVWSGSLARRPRLRLGAMRPGGKKRYIFVVTLSPLAGNQYQGATLRFSCRWSFRRSSGP